MRVSADGSQLSRLLQYLEHSGADIEDFGALSRVVRYHKVNDEGVEYMCKVVDDYGIQKKEEGIAIGKEKEKVEMIENLVKNGVSLEVSLKSANIDMDEFQLLKRKFGEAGEETRI